MNRRSFSNRLLGSLAAAALATAALAGCSGSTASPGGGSDQLEGSWQLTSGIDAEGSIPLTADAPVTLNFADNASGTAACNSYFATVLGGPGTIEVSGVGSTEMYCIDESVMEVESRYLAALGAANRAVYEGEELVITGPDVELRFDETDGSSLPPVDTPTKDPDSPVTGCDGDAEDITPGYVCPQDGE